MTAARLLLAAALALVPIGGCGGAGDDAPDQPDARATPDADPTVPDAAPREVITGGQLLQPGELVEGVMSGGPDDHAVIYLMAPTATMDWNIHGHADGGTQTLVEVFDVDVVEHVFVPTAEADWWLLIRNGGIVDMEVQVRVELHGDMTWRWE